MKKTLDKIPSMAAVFILLAAMMVGILSVAASSTPTIEFTYIPPIGSYDNLQGKVTNVSPADYKVAVYIYVSGWWTKPNWDYPLTSINNDGSWITDITTGGSDQYATKVRAYLVPNGYNPPLMNGQQIFPDELETNKVAQVEAQKRQERIINFSGRSWIVKYSVIPEGPGLNYFSDSNDSIWVDEQGQLHLKIIKVGNTWYNSEVILKESLGYGEYVFYLASRADKIDKNAVLGMFTWDTFAPLYNYREMDIELSKWGQDANDNSQFVVQPWSRGGNIYRFNADFAGNYSVHSFNWSASKISFKSLRGLDISSSNSSDLINSWVYTGSDIPPPGGENARINLWLFDPAGVLGKPPSDGKEVEVIIKEFKFVPQGSLPNSIKVVSPNGGENWHAGTTKKIKWKYTGNPGSRLKIELLKGKKKISTINSNVSIGKNGNGSYKWSINPAQQPGNYKIRITSKANPIYKDKSNKNFTINPAKSNGTIKVSLIIPEFDVGEKRNA